MSDRCLHTAAAAAAYLRLAAEQFIFRLLGVSEERVLDHAKHVASARSPLLVVSPPFFFFADNFFLSLHWLPTPIKTSINNREQ